MSNWKHKDMSFLSINIASDPYKFHSPKALNRLGKVAIKTQSRSQSLQFGPDFLSSFRIPFWALKTLELENFHEIKSSRILSQFFNDIKACFNRRSKSKVVTILVW